MPHWGSQPKGHIVFALSLLFFCACACQCEPSLEEKYDGDQKDDGEQKDDNDDDENVILVKGDTGVAAEGVCWLCL